MMSPLCAALVLLNFTSVGTTVAPFAGSSTEVAGQPRLVYRVEEIDPDPAFPNLQAVGLTDDGLKGGTYRPDEVESNSRAARWRVSSEVEVLEGAGGQTWAVDLNSIGTMLGAFRDESERLLPSMWSLHGNLEQIALPPGTTGYSVNDLNNIGEVTGFIQTSGGSDAVIWREGKIVKIPRYPGFGHNSGSQISDNGIVMGYSIQGETQAVWLWSEWRGLYLDYDDQGRRLQAQWLNAKGDYAGLSRAGAFRRIGSTVTYFEPRPAVATRLNERGDALGYDVNDRLVVWPFEGGKIDVEASLDRSSGYVRLYDAPVAGFNNHGQIVVVAIRSDGARRQVLLTPQSASVR